MKLADLKRDYRPGSFDPPWSWDDERNDVLSSGHIVRTAELLVSIRRNGIRKPVLLGDDGRVWDGHHRIVVAEVLGLDEIPTTDSVDDYYEPNDLTDERKPL